MKNIISYQLGNPVLSGDINNLRTFSLFYDLINQNLKLIGQVVPEVWSDIHEQRDRHPNRENYLLNVEIRVCKNF